MEPKRDASEPELPNFSIRSRISLPILHSSSEPVLTLESDQSSKETMPEKPPLRILSSEETGAQEQRSDPFDDLAVLDLKIAEDSGERTFTFRSILVGIMAAIVGACISEVFAFKPVVVNVDVLFLQIFCLAVGHFFARIPGPVWWNPGPLATKEAVFSLIVAASASATVQGVDIIATQQLMFDKHIPVMLSFLTLMSNQLILYAVAGLLQPLLVYPAKIIFPGVLPIVAIFQSMSKRSKTTKDQMSFFKKTIYSISLYEIIPTYLAPALSAVSVWCLALPKVPAITNLFGGSLPAEGIGLMAFSGDWTLVGSHSPLYVPLIAQITSWMGYFAFIVVFSWAYTANWFGGGAFPFISYSLFDKSGNRYNTTEVVFKNGTANPAGIQQFGLPYMATSYVLSKGLLAMAASASTTIAIFSSIMSFLKDRKETKMHGKTLNACPHREITKKLRNFPNYVFVAVLFGGIGLALLSSHLAQSGLSPAGLLTAILLSMVLSVSVGYYYGTIGLLYNISTPVQVIGGILFPGNAIGNMWFTMFGSSVRCVLLLKDMKLGTYMHLAPYLVIIAQLIGMVIGILVHILVMMLIVKSEQEVLLMPNGNGVFSGMHLSRWRSQATACGLFSRELFYPGKIYAIVLYLLIIGFLAPIPFIILKRFRPKSVLSGFNVSLFTASMSDGIIGSNSGRFTGVVIGLLSQFYMRKYHFKWFKKYNYILCAALDGGTLMTVVLLAFLFQGLAGYEVKIPTYFLNPTGTRDYCRLFNSNSAR